LVSLNIRIAILFALLSGLLITILPVAAAPAKPPLSIHLRRAVFDPLRSTPTIAARLAAPDSRLALIQLDTAPDAQARARLAAAGLRVLAYVPDNTFLVQLQAPPWSALAALPGVRWSGPFAPAYKLSPDLDPLLSSSNPAPAEVWLQAAPDADATTLERALATLGGTVLGHSAGLNGMTLRVRLPAAALRAAILRDDVLWIERLARPTPLNDRSRRILGVDQARLQLGLDGAGQIVAVTDTGLDVQADVLANANPDFPAARVAGGFSPHDMNPTCTEQVWDDHHGHGTHVAGSVLGSGARSPAGRSFAGMAPGARLVIQGGGDDLVCLDVSNDDYLASTYAAGARVQNASWGDSNILGAYDGYAQVIDDFVWRHQDHLMVVAAGNSGQSPNSITTPATAKNILSVGASDGNSENIDSLAFFSSQGPTDDGRIKPEIVAPGVRIISARSHDPSAIYPATYNSDYAYDSGTSMATPMISGMAALVRQWLARDRAMETPSAALTKALLLNGAASIAPASAWPNNAAGWGRATMTDTLGLRPGQNIWLYENSGIQAGALVSYTLTISASQPLRITLAWSDYPAAAFAGKALINDLDLALVTPDGTIVRGNTSAMLPTTCRDSAGADRCNNSESIEIGAPRAGVYSVRVRGAVVPNGPQPFALVARAGAGGQLPGRPTLQPITGKGSAIKLRWSAVADALFYQVVESERADFATIRFTQSLGGTALTRLEEIGGYYFRVRACNPAGCGPFSAAQPAQVNVAPWKVILLLIYH
jgi:subtilisin family serine protease